MDPEKHHVCVTREELAGLFEEAFARWHSGPGDPDGRRQTPRIPLLGSRLIRVVSYVHGGREVALNRSAAILDISADGLGIELDEAVPLGAVICFAFDGAGSERSLGVASVVHLAEHGDGFALGLSFGEAAGSLDVDLAGREATAPPALRCRRHRGFERLRAAADRAYHVLTRRGGKRRELRRKINDQAVRFVVEAKLFRFTACLFVDGRKIVSQSGALNDRFHNLISDAALPTMVSLHGDGFSAWATLQANSVMDCSLEPAMEIPSLPDLPAGLDRVHAPQPALVSTSS